MKIKNFDFSEIFSNYVQRKLLRILFFFSSDSKLLILNNEMIKFKRWNKVINDEMK